MQVDGFRHDIMGHLMLSTMQKVQARLAALTEAEHGVDGRAIYMYGEVCLGSLPYTCIAVHMPYDSALYAWRCMPVSCSTLDCLAASC